MILYLLYNTLNYIFREDFMTKDKLIEFVRKKDFKFVEELSNGSFGKTVLLKDDNINHNFVCKKYEPLKGINKEDYYTHFINEIKLLHLLYHDNIVRIFNYYLYPEKYTGYIMMEYVEGEDILSHLKKFPENLNSVFEQTIKGFVYLEDNNILHRDIRPTNIMVDDNSNVKIIDFGFGKQIEFEEDNNKSISINWWGSVTPTDFDKKIYDNKTEIFFLGLLFQDIIQEIDSDFKYKHILKEMIKQNYEDRINSFNEIYKSIVEDDNTFELFTNEEKRIYQNFVQVMSDSLSQRESSTSLVMDSDKIIKKLDELKQKTILEDYINSKHLLGVLISGKFKYYNQSFDTHTLKEFLQFFKSISKEKQNIVLYNVETRFNDVESYTVWDDDNEIPF